MCQQRPEGGFEPRSEGRHPEGMQTRLVTVALSMFVLALATGTSAQVPTCGNGTVEPPEVCDDGNLVDGDGCDSNCTPTACGNGIVTAGRGGGHGETGPGEGCSATLMNVHLPAGCSPDTAS